ncbi:MAG: hypothetical protein BM557_11030 [Flavobacterium sp. MedPE-SWcel]|uniref:hypothetical protein n=1 Tax=uncultured Flavobacterium sp. TaxID=165435 RepID=UPI00091B294E|nr:hypothetical protein [uncultured Flavobacterium sp.]OIQ15824.1 MAG: hypothetical protein BM557_11030 [Flavobacterium sp. MedPE-SWcel]
MNDAHFHLAVNHLPIIIPIIGVLIMLGGFITRSAIVKRTAYFVFILGALSTIPAAASGEGAEEIVEEMHIVSHDIIHEHEEVAETFILLSYALGGIALLGLWANFKNKSFATPISIATLLFSFVVIFFASKAGTTGGEIRHTEIREGATIDNSEHEHYEEEHEEHEHYDDD